MDSIFVQARDSENSEDSMGIWTP